MKGLAPQVIEYFDNEGIPNELKYVVKEKYCACGQGVHRLIYTLAKTAVHYWYAQHSISTQREKALKLELQQSQAEVRLLKQRLFGKKTENQKSSEQSINQSRNKRPRGQQPGSNGHGRKQQNLEVIEETITLLADDACCPSCQLPYASLASTEDSEIVEVAVKGYTRKVKRQKYKSCCGCQGTPKFITAPAVPRLIEKGKLGTSIWASLLFDKYGGHTPTYRYLDKLSTYGIELAQGTITDGLKKIAPLLTPVVEAMMKKSQSEKHWHADETRWEVFEPIEGKVSSRWYLWVFKSKSVVYYKLSPSRGYRVPQDFFVGLDLGIVNCDRYVVYKKLEKNGIVILALCWAHVRRDFLEIAKSHPTLAEWAHGWVEQIGLIYKANKVRLSAIHSHDFEGAHKKLALLIQASADKLNAEVNEANRDEAAQKVLRSLSNHWRGLTVFVEHPEIPMDNNAAERSLRGPVTGRKGYYGSGSIWSADLAASLFTIIQTVKQGGLNPLTWLYHYLEACLHNKREPPSDLTPYLPWCMKEDRCHLLSKPLDIFPGFDIS